MFDKYLRTIFLVCCLIVCRADAGFAQEDFEYDEEGGEFRIEGEEYKPVPEEIQAKLLALLPDPDPLKLDPLGDIQFYGNDLYLYINGAASSYHDYGFVALAHGDYAHGDTHLGIDIYDMGTPLQAFGIYAAERAPEYQFISIGTEGYQEKDLLHFLQSSYYVKLSTFSETDETAPLLQSVAEAISNNIDGGKTLPAAVRRLPAQNRVAHSEKYLNKAVLGYEFLAPAVQAEYRWNDRPTTLILSAEPIAASEAAEKIVKLRDQLSANGAATPYPELGPHAFRGEDRYRGKLVGFIQPANDRLHDLIFVIQPPDPFDPFLDAIRASVSKPAESPESTAGR